MLISHEVTFLDDKFAIGITNLTFSKPRYSRSITLNIIDVQLLNRVQLFETPWTHARLPYPSPSPRACSSSCPLSHWCYAIVSYTVTPFSSCSQSFPASRSFPVNQLFPSEGQSIRALTSSSVFPMKMQGWFPVGLTSLISWQSKGLSRVFFSTSI